MSPADQFVSLKEVEEIFIRARLRHFAGDMDKACKSLQIGRATLYNKCKKYGIDYGAFRRRAHEQAETLATSERS